jgi:hypothetical protein
MKRLLRALVIALSLVISAATAHAECAWVLWQQQGEISPSGSVSSSEWTWLTAEATSTEAECRQVSARFGGGSRSADAQGAPGIAVSSRPRRAARPRPSK